MTTSKMEVHFLHLGQVFMKTEPVEKQSEDNVMKQEYPTHIKKEIFSPSHIDNTIQETNPKLNDHDIAKMLIKPDVDKDDEDYELTPSDIEKEFEEFHEEDEKANSGKTVLENNTTAYKCQMCKAIFIDLSEYKSHKKAHFVEKRRCNLCNIVCKSIGKLEIHLNGHLGLKPHKCDQCNKGFSSKHEVKLHARCHNTELRYKCEKCDKAFRNMGSLRSHTLVHQEKIKEFICKICNEDCQILPAYRKHMEKHGTKADITCGVCNKRFGTDRHLQMHLNTHKDLKFPCEFCGKIYQSMYRIKRHIKRAHIPNQCEECNKVFYDRAEYTKHKKQHNEGKPVTCEFCSKAFDKAKNLSEHIRLQHKKDEKEHKCHICEKAFINLALLKNHVKTHDKCFKCPHCDRLFSSRYNLQTHSVTHTGARNHRCDICGNFYSTKSSLKNHQATHTDIKSFQCDQCPKQFKTNRRLYVHKLSHSTEEKYECEICHSRFRVKQYLKYHMIKHSTEKPYKCNVCTKKFKHKKSFEKHMALGRHKKLPGEQECDFCDETFTTRDLLLDHFNEVHRDENVINGYDSGDADFDPANRIVKVEMDVDNRVNGESVEIVNSEAIVLSD